MESSLFLHNVTHVDCAVVENGKFSGLSFVPVFQVTGSTDNEEQVVMDFSKLKKAIKEAIDSKDFGFDHKLIIPDGSANVKELDETYCVVSGKDWTFECPRNAVKRISNSPELSLLQNLEKALSDYLNLAFDNFDIKVIIPTPEPVYPNGLPALLKDKCAMAYTFEYTHGLPKSSSWGCQNAVHGHTSFIHFGSDSDNDDALANVAELVTAYLDESYFVCKDHVTSNNGSTVVIEYETERGRFKLDLLKTSFHVVIMDKEPTIENIIDHVVETFSTNLKEASVTNIGISEGLWKGSLRKI